MVPRWTIPLLVEFALLIALFDGMPASVANPFGFGLLALSSWLIFRESVTVFQLSGLVYVFFGITLLSCGV
jgi:multidrug transporter EmrE-like cation transporter